MSFKKIGISPELRAQLVQFKLKEAYPIQNQAIPSILKSKDVLGIAKTGSGKTLSYVLPILMQSREVINLPNRHIPFLILVPTRELAVQVEEVFSIYSRAYQNGPKCMAVYGGVSINPQMKRLSGTSILVATPGRLIELMESNALKLNRVQTLVLDEADKMLNMGFREEMEQIFKLLPKRRQNLLFSATLNEGIERIQGLILRDPKIVKIEEAETDIELIQQSAYAVEQEQKGLLLRYLLKENEMKQVLVFCSSIYQADHVSDKLKKNGFNSRAIHSKKSQGARMDALRMFKDGQLNILVTTDLLARGIDIEFLPFVINYELPRSPKDYIHRIGRTGRAENPGEAISFISLKERPHFKVIQKKMGKWIKLIYSEDMDL